MEIISFVVVTKRNSWNHNWFIHISEVLLKFHFMGYYINWHLSISHLNLFEMLPNNRGLVILIVCLMSTLILLQISIWMMILNMHLFHLLRWFRNYWQCLARIRESPNSKIIFPPKSLLISVKSMIVCCAQTSISSIAQQYLSSIQIFQLNFSISSEYLSNAGSMVQINLAVQKHFA